MSLSNVCHFFVQSLHEKQIGVLLCIQHWQKVIFSHKKRNIFVKKQFFCNFISEHFFCSYVVTVIWIESLIFGCLCAAYLWWRDCAVFQEYCFLGQCFVFQEITKFQEPTFKAFFPSIFVIIKRNVFYFGVFEGLCFLAVSVIHRWFKHNLHEMILDMTQGHFLFCNKQGFLYKYNSDSLAL